MKMNNSVDFNGNHYSCRMIDIREMDPEIFLRSDKSKEVVLAILAGGDSYDRRQVIRRILMQLQKLLPDEGGEMQRRIQELEILSGMRKANNLQKQIIEEVQKMPIVYDIRGDLRFQQGVAEGDLKLHKVVKSMMKAGLSIKVIQEYTGLSIEELEKLKREQ